MTCREALTGKRILLVEDDYYMVSELAQRLAAMDVIVAAKCPGVAEALGAIAAATDLDAAILDINLSGEMVFPVADRLERLGIPFIFATGYDPDVLPDRHADKIVLRKPVEVESLALVLSDVARPRTVSIEEALQNDLLALLPARTLKELLRF